MAILASHDNSATTTARILLVDNEPDNTSVLSMGLEDEGYKVDAFNDPMLALSNFKPNYYSLVILDINMPKMKDMNCIKN
jgi:two-component system response regulator ChvI